MAHLPGATSWRSQGSQGLWPPQVTAATTSFAPDIFTPYRPLFLSFSHMETYRIEGSPKAKPDMPSGAIERGRESDTLPLGRITSS